MEGWGIFSCNRSNPPDQQEKKKNSAESEPKFDSLINQASLAALLWASFDWLDGTVFG
jgi:hypothetical protein